MEKNLLEDSYKTLQTEHHQNLSNLGSLQAELHHESEQLRALMDERNKLIQQLTVTNNQLSDVSLYLLIL